MRPEHTYIRTPPQTEGRNMKLGTNDVGNLYKILAATQLLAAMEISMSESMGESNI